MKKIIFYFCLIASIFLLASPALAASVEATVVNGKDIQLSWSAVSGATYYNVMKNGNFLSPVTTTTFVDANVADGTYTYQIVPFNAMNIALPDVSDVTVTKTGGTIKTSTPVVGPVIEPSAPRASDISVPTPKFSSVPEMMGNIVTWLLGLAGGLAFIAIVYSGILYITAGGDAEKAAKARKNLLWAVLGLIIIFLCFGVVFYVNEILKSP